MLPLPFAQTSPENESTIVAAVLLLALMAALVFWRVMFGRYRVGGYLLERGRRRRVPWHGLEVIVVVAVHMVFAMLAMVVVERVLGPELMKTLPKQEGVAPDTSHTILRGLATGGPWVLVLAVFAVVVVAPVVEEFLFRVVLQGWLEACVERWSIFLPGLRRILPGALGPVLISSLLFGGAHFRLAGPQHHSEYYVALNMASMAVGLLTLVVGVALLRYRAGATAADLGVVPGKVAGDVRLGIGWLMGLLGPIYVVQIACHMILPKTIAPDPIPLFLLALGLGFLYARTHRIVPCIVLHAGLNAASLALAWATL